MRKSMIILYLALVSWGVTAKHDLAANGEQANSQLDEPMFKDKAMASAYTQYINLKNALVASDFQKAKSTSESLMKAIQEVKGSQKAQAEMVKVAQSNSLENQRKAFTALSNEMVVLVKTAEISSGELYLEYCPMANGNTGGYWLSNEKEIRNPYFGDKMMKCGSVKETIN